MNFELSEEQEMLRDAARGALSRHETLSAARAALDGDELPDLWPTAIDAGWPGLLLADRLGGAGLGAFDAMLVAQECGRRLAWTGLVGHLTGTRLLSAAESDPRLDAALERLATGEIRVAAALAQPPLGSRGWAVEAADGQERLVEPPRVTSAEQGKVTGSVGFVPDVPGADLIAVVAKSGEGLGVALIEAGADGLQVEPLLRYDGSRPLAHVRLDNSPAELIDVPEDEIAATWHLAQALLAAEALGATEAALELGVEYAKEREAFGRPIGSFQAVKHQLVEVLRGIERLRSMTYYAGWAAESRPGELALAANGARRAGEAAIDVGSRTVMAVHGGIGATWEHDAHLFFRRSQLSRLLLGGSRGAADRVADELLRSAERRPAAAA